MTASAALHSHEAKRVRASERALRIALKVMQDAGLAVDKVCVSGGQIEIHCGGVEKESARENDEGLKDW